MAAVPTSSPRAAAFAAWWQKLAPRERVGAALAAALVVVLLLWLIAIQPALTTLRQAPAQIAALDAQLQRMQRLALEGRELRGAAPVPLAQATAALKSATDRLGSHGSITILGDRATLTLKGATGPELSTWLGEARGVARARPIEAQLTRGSAGYDGTIVVALGGGNS